MTKTVSTALILLLLTSIACAETFRCTDATGKVTFTDDPAGLRGCQPLTVQSPPSGPMSRPDTQTSPATSARDAAPAPKAGVAEDEFSLFLNEATALVEEYRVTVKKVHTAKFKKDTLEARRNLLDIRQRKKQLLEELAAARLLLTDEQTIRQTLAEIPDND